MLIFGSSGSGKTYSIQCPLAEMAGQRLRSIIIDYTDGFLPQHIEPLFGQAAQPRNYSVISDQLPLNPFRRQKYILDPSQPPFEERPFNVATRIASIFTSVFTSMGDQQQSALTRVLKLASPTTRNSHWKTCWPAWARKLIWPNPVQQTGTADQSQTLSPGQ